MLTKARFLLIVAVAAALTTTMMVGMTLADGSLKRGDKGDKVEELQRLLKKQNCYDYKEITGYYGVSTENGVRKFQSTHGLTVDGVAGSETIQKLKDSPVGKTLNPDSLCLGMSDAKVQEIQKRLKELGLFNESKTTKYFGPKTEAAVKLFQQAVGMKADGIVGKKTRDALFDTHSTNTLAPGMKGDEVEKLQKRLKDLGYFSGTVSGLYGQATVKAVARFQKLNKLDDDGIAGKKTRTAIFAKNAKKEKDARRSQSTTPSKPKYEDVPGQSAAGQEKSQDVVEYAKKFLGRPYVYGANGPNSFDCTGLTCYVYKNFGVSLPRSAYAQGYTNYGIKITDKSKLMPGDLVFFNSRRDSDLSDHAGIYIGNGQFIHSPQTGDVVKISSLAARTNFSWARRVFK